MVFEDMDEQDVLDMCRTLWGEARGEDDEGMRAVCCTIINRYKSGRWYGKPTISETVRLKYQFSCWNKNDPNYKPMIKLTFEELKRELTIVKKVTDDGYEDITHGATHYYNPNVCKEPLWAKEQVPCYVHGHHLFFRGIK